MGAIASGTCHSWLHKLSFAWYSRVSNDTTPPEVTTLRTRAIAGKLSFAHSPATFGRLTNTLASTNTDEELDTETHSWSPTDVYPPSSHTDVTGSPVTRFTTSVDVLVVSGHAENDGATLGVVVGVAVGLAVGVTVGELVVGTTEGTEEGTLLGPWLAVGVTVGTAVGTPVGVSVGVLVGTSVGVAVGTELGVSVGDELGVIVGIVVGTLDGVDVGVEVGTSVGTAVGNADGT